MLDYQLNEQGERVMAVGFTVDFFYYSIGSADFLHSFFSTVAVNLEGGKWGSRFPVLMNELYQGKLPVEKADIASEELNTIREELKKFSPDKVVWDIDDLSKQPPWGKNISKDITDLSNYFVTSDGEDFISVIFKALNDSKEMNAPVEIMSL